MKAGGQKPALWSTRFELIIGPRVSGVTPGAGAPLARSRDPSPIPPAAVSLVPYCMDAAVMQLGRHGCGSHAVRLGAGGTRVAGAPPARRSGPTPTSR